MFRTYSVAVEFLSFRIEVYSERTNGLVAQGYALPSSLLDTFGRTSVPLLTKKGLPVGKIYFGYLFVRPIRLPHPHQTMHNCYAKHWKKRTTLEVGHRGMGNSYTKFAVARENTLHSLNSAAKNGADFVEFDVHLTKDKIPVVYHDFHVMVTVARRVPTTTDSDTDDGKKPAEAGVDFYQLAVKDLKLSQLRLLHLDHVSHSHSTTSADGVAVSHSQQRVTGEHDEAEEHRPFPTMCEAFQNVSEEVHFNVEVKYPQLMVNGENECDGYFERNEFVDIILAQVLNHAGNRRIVFSSFEPDICKMISAKQKKYPVLLLCLGESTRHINYADERTRTSMTAVKFAYASGLMGVNFNSEDLLRDPSPVAKAKELGLISFVWGDELIEKKHVDYFKKTLGVEGLIYDRIGEGEVRTNVFTLEKAMKAALFSSKKSTSTSPVAPPRCSSHTQLNSQGNRTRSSSAWTSSHGQCENGGNSVTAMFSIGEVDAPAEFPVIRRHNSSQVNGYGPLTAAIYESTQMASNGMPPKRFVTTNSEI